MHVLVAEVIGDGAPSSRHEILPQMIGGIRLRGTLEEQDDQPSKDPDGDPVVNRMQGGRPILTRARGTRNFCVGPFGCPSYNFILWA
jgi:hypothetical protein